MSETQTVQKSSALKALPVIGVAAVLLGAVLWIIGATQLASDQATDAYANSFIGASGGDSYGGDQALIWVGVIILIIGVALLITRWVIAAAQK